MSKVKIDRFADEFEFLSNFHPAPVHVDNDLYPTVEHAYQAAKTLDQKERELVRDARGPGAAKALGKSVTLRPAWDDIKDNVMRDLLWEKFNQYTDVKSLLIATGDAELVEGNTWGDRYWGVDAKTGEGENRLGKMLMETRSKIVKNVGTTKFLRKVMQDLPIMRDIMSRAGLPFDVRSLGEGSVVVVKDEDGDDLVELRFNKDDDLVGVVAVNYDVPF